MTIVAECGQNHMGDMSLAHQLIFLAKTNGADLVKFQLYSHQELYKDHPEIPNVELSKEQAFDLFYYGKEVGIEVFFSVFDVERVKWCEQMGVKRYKVAYSQTDNLPLLDAIGNTQKPCFLSYKDEFSRTWLRVGRMATLLYCIPSYPTKLEDVNFPILFDGEYSWADGFSDHTIGLDAAKIALARGAQIIEKHFSLCYTMGIDGAWSMTPSDLGELKRWESVCQTVLSL